jgi:membrane-associated protease RseP (regulator of RpoE activity)
MPFFTFISEFILNPWFIISLIFWVIVIALVLLLRNKKGAYTLFFPLLALFKTKKLNNIIVRIAKKNPKFWRVFWNIGIFVSFGFTIYGFFFFTSNIINLIYSPSIENAIVPLIPGVTIDLPIFLYLLLPLLLILTTHEFAHGISASIDGVEIKSTGVLGIGLFYLVGFGAFVEVDERALNSTKFHRNTRLRIAAAGTYINSIVAGIALIFLLIFPLMISPLFNQVSQVYRVLSPQQGGFNSGILEYGDTIIAIKIQGQPNSEYIYLDEYKGINLGSILNNDTDLKTTVGDNLTLKIYNPFSDTHSEKDIILGPKYNLRIDYDYISNDEIRISYNYTSDQATNIVINQINGTKINQTSGDTLELYLTNFNLRALNLSNVLGDHYIIRPEVVGVYVGVQTVLYWMYKNDFAKFLTPNWPDFWLKELSWLFIIGFSLTLFNMMPLPIFDGDRIIKEILNSLFGRKYTIKKTRREKFVYDLGALECKLSEYRIEEIKEVKITDRGKDVEVILGKDNYELTDGIGDGFNDTVQISLKDPSNLSKNTIFEVEYDYLEDAKARTKKFILNTIRIIALALIIGNFLLSFMKFGFNLFWIQ